MCLSKDCTCNVKYPPFTTVEGHTIVRDGIYETRAGWKAIVFGFNKEDRNRTIVGTMPSIHYSHSWYSDGKDKLSGQSVHDLMRPWVDKPKYLTIDELKAGNAYTIDVMGKEEVTVVGILKEPNYTQYPIIIRRNNKLEQVNINYNFERRKY